MSHSLLYINDVPRSTRPKDLRSDSERRRANQTGQAKEKSAVKDDDASDQQAIASVSWLSEFRWLPGR